MMRSHAEKIVELQEQMLSFFSQENWQLDSFPISLECRSGHSNTVRSKSYKKGSQKLNVNALNAIIQIDPKKCVAIVEPRVTIDELVKATILYGLIPPVVPEFKGITVGGAIMGGAAESGSHLWGCFNDNCLSIEVLCGNGAVIKASPKENADIFYGVPCSYGSLGILLSAEIRLIPAYASVHLYYHVCSSADEAIRQLQKLMHSQRSPVFLDGIVFSKDLAVIVEGVWQKESEISKKSPQFSLKPLYSEWYYQHVEKIVSESTIHEEIMSLYDYLFRYDQGAFWVGSYLFRSQFLIPFIFQGIFKLNKLFQKEFTQHTPPRPNIFWRTLLHPLMTSQNLWKLHHLAEKWVQNRTIIQDFCIPEEKASVFLKETIQETGTFPIWLCPIKSTYHPQIFAPHFSKNNSMSHFINIGIYGLPAYRMTIENITKILEQKTTKSGGRKVLYSRSYFTPDEFWQIYPRDSYDLLRKKTASDKVLHEITDKVL